MNKEYFNKVGFVKQVQPTFLEIFTMEGKYFMCKLSEIMYDKLKYLDKNTIVSVIYDKKKNVSKVSFL